MPVIDGVRELIDAGMVAGGTQRNHAFVSESVDWNGLAENEQLLLADAQTSGGLLLAVERDAVPDLLNTLGAHGTLAAAIVGETRTGPAGAITVHHGRLSS